MESQYGKSILGNPNGGGRPKTYKILFSLYIKRTYDEIF